MWWPCEAIGDRVALHAHDRPGPDRVSECLSCRGVIIVEESRHSPPTPPPPTFVGGPGIYHFSMFSVRGRLSRGIYHFFTFFVRGRLSRGIYHFSTLFVRGRLSQGIYHFSTCWWWRLLVRLCFRWGVDPMSVLSILSPLFKERQR